MIKSYDFLFLFFNSPLLCVRKHAPSHNDKQGYSNTLSKSLYTVAMLIQGTQQMGYSINCQNMREGNSNDVNNMMAIIKGSTLYAGR